MAFVAERDSHDRVRFSPLQTPLSQKLCGEFGIQLDLSTAVLIESTTSDQDQTAVAVYYTHSDAILRLFPHLGFPYSVAGPLLLFWIPKFLRDYGYRIFARHRGTIWKCIKRCFTGLGDTSLYAVRDRIVGVHDKNMDESTAASWGLQKPARNNDDSAQKPS